MTLPQPTTVTPDAAGRSDTGARVSRIALLPYLVFYSAFDSVVGLSNGLVVRCHAVRAHRDAAVPVRRDPDDLLEAP